jgi:glycosyltransferase involved in cell wall biosynthesis
MEVIYNPIEVPSQIISLEEVNSTKSSFKIIAVGTLNHKKNHMMIVRALKIDKSNFELKILGAGPLKNEIFEEIKTASLENQVFLEGKVKNVNAFLLESDCFVLSSFAEGFPNALLEAMAIGLPCISTNCLSGPLEMLNENAGIEIKSGSFYKAKYGILINNDDSIGLISALNFLKNNPEERVKYSKLGLERSKDYHLKSIYSEFADFIIR